MSNTTSRTYARLAATLIAAAALTACGGGGDDGSSGPIVGQNGAVDVGTVSMPAGQTCGIGNFAPALLAAINQARAQARNCGGNAFAAAPPLGWNSLLTQAAVRHSTDMASKGFFSHNGSDGSSYIDRIRDTGYQGGLSEILNLSQGGSFSVSRSMNSWLGSPGHCSAIMDPLATEIGGACVQAGNKAYFTVDIGG